MNGLSLAAALLLGLAASGHCLLMCGGISTALGLATAKNARGMPRPALLAAYQLGRVASYAVAGLLLAGLLGGAVALLDSETLRRALRLVAAGALLLAAGVAWGRVRAPDFGLGHTLWLRLAPLGRRLLPVRTLPRALAFGMVWGWMPCGFVYTVLLLATVQGDAAAGAMTMAAFGLGTAPALLATAFGAERLAGITAGRASRQLAAALLVIAAVLTAAAPWLAHALPGLEAVLPFHCVASR